MASPPQAHWHGAFLPPSLFDARSHPGSRTDPEVPTPVPPTLGPVTMPAGGPTREGARATYEAKRWNTSCTDDGWSGKLVSLAWNESDGHVEEKWKWTPPAKDKAKAKGNGQIKKKPLGKPKKKATANGNGNGKIKKKPLGKPK